MDDYLSEHILYSSMAKYDKDSKMVFDENGYVIFRDLTDKLYIPTIFDPRIKVVKAYIEERIFEEKYSYRNIREIRIFEESSGEEDDVFDGFHRTSIFKMNGDGIWILTNIYGTNSYSFSDELS